MIAVIAEAIAVIAGAIAVIAGAIAVIANLTVDRYSGEIFHRYFC